jgi:predicted phage-related endonuclease
VGPDDFEERRRHRIGASDVAAALSGAFDQTPASIVASKLEILDRAEPTERMVRGHALEDRTVDAAATLLDLDVLGRQVEVAHPEHPWLVATLDALVVTADDRFAPLEVKTTSSPDGYPDEYLSAQLHTQMACLSVEVGFSAVWDIPRSTLTVTEHRADPVVTYAAVEMAHVLWEHLSDRRIPKACYPADASLWNRLRPASLSRSVELPDELVADLVAARAELKAATGRADVLEAQVKELLDTAELGTVDGVPRVRWQTVTSRRVDLKTLELEAPELVEAHRVPSTVRRFTVLSPPIRQPRKATP